MTATNSNDRPNPPGEGTAHAPAEIPGGRPNAGDGLAAGEKADADRIKPYQQPLRRRLKNLVRPRVWLLALLHLAVFATVYRMAFLLHSDVPGALSASDDMKIFWGTLAW